MGKRLNLLIFLNIIYPRSICSGDNKKEVFSMSTIARQALTTFETLDSSSQLAVLRFAEFLAAEAELTDDVSLYDEAKAADDGYRISSKDLRAKYGM